MKPETGVTINVEDESAKNPNCGKLNFNPRELQREIVGNRIKIYQCGKKLFAKLDGNDCENDKRDKKMANLGKKDTNNCDKNLIVLFVRKKLSSN
jgi:hypothetical protein